MRCTKGMARFRGLAAVSSLLAAVLALSLAGAAGVHAGSAPAPMPVGITFVNNAGVAIWVARERGFFARHGVNVEVVQFRGDTQGMQALVAGQVPMLFCSGPAGLTAAAQGMDVIQVATIRPKMPYSLVVRPELNRVEDLKGKAVGVSGAGMSASRLSLVIALQQFGVDPRRDRVAFIPTGTEGERLAALVSGAIQGTVLNTVPYARLASQRGMRVLYDLTELDLPWIQDAVHTSRRFLSQNRDRVEAVLKGLVESYAFILNPRNKAVVVDTLARNLRIDAAEAEEAYQDVLRFVPRRPFPSKEALRAMVAAGEDVMPELARLDLDRFVETSVLADLERSGFFDSLM